MSRGLPPPASTALSALPSGWGLTAVDAIARGAWPLAAESMAGLLALIGLMLAALAAILSRQSTATAPATVALGRRMGSSHTPRAARRGTAIGAAVAKELRTWWRDLSRVNLLCFALCYGLLVCTIPLVGGWTGMLPWTGVVAVTMAAAVSANLYGSEGTALWVALLTPRAPSIDVRAKQAGWLIVTGPLALLITAATTAAGGQAWAWPWALALTAAVLGGGAALLALMSVAALVPVTDPQLRRGSPLNVGDNGGAVVGQTYLMLALVPLTALPAAGVVLAGTLLRVDALRWAGVPVAITTATLFVWGFGRIAARRLEARGPGLLSAMRAGTSTAAPAKSTRAPLPKGRTAIVTICWTLCWLPLFPQGIDRWCSS